MWKLALNYANNFSKQQTVGKMSVHELLSLNTSGSGWDNVIILLMFLFAGLCCIQGRRNRGARGTMGPTFWQTMQKCPFRIQKCPFQIHNIITFNLILIIFTVERDFGILFFHFYL